MLGKLSSILSQKLLVNINRIMADGCQLFLFVTGTAKCLVSLVLRYYVSLLQPVLSQMLIYPPLKIASVSYFI